MYSTEALKDSFKKIENWLSKEFSQLHTGRASPMILDNIFVEVYGAPQPIKTVGSVSIEDAKTLRITPWDKANIKALEKAIASANLGLSVVSDDQGIRAILPQLTSENRENLIKILKQHLEEARINVRKEREQVIRALKDNLHSEDDVERAKAQIQKMVDEVNQNLEALFEKKALEVRN